uniref:Glucose dehydrogenase n=1 Tax=Hemiscolopendra marginata TaxID=943146 RepID=A0A646QF74_9MYRI
MAPLNLTAFYLPSLMSVLLRFEVKPFAEPTILDSYDYIIIGSGFGGSVVANRLSGNLEHNVLLLEAGSKDNVTAHVPILSTTLINGGYDWKYETVPQKMACHGSSNNICKLVSGKVVGGSSVLDLMGYFRGHKEDFDKWEKLGNPGWSYDDVMPFFKKSENYRMDGECVESEFHGCGGDLFIGPLPEGAEGEETKYLMEGAKEMGLEEIDYDGRTQVGVSRCHFTMRNGVRQSAATAFLRPVKERPNLHISLDSLVHKIIIDSETKTATGVQFEKDGKIIEVKAKKEVILSAGVYSSPKILMLSGIGPKEELEKFKIPLIADLPGVGQNLLEKISSFVIFTTGKTFSEERENVISTPTIKEWNKGTGLMASSSGMDAVALMRSKYADKNSELADLLILYQSFPLYATTEPFFKAAFGYGDEFWANHFIPYVNKEIGILHPIVLLPKSKGSVTIRSSDPHDLPVIDPNIYEDERDMKVLSEGVRMASEFINTTLFKKNKFYIGKPLKDECEEFGDPLSDEHTACFLKYSTTTKWCACCSNKMGPESDPMAVVDHRLRVRGIKNLRIADASVMPQQYSALPGAGVIMIGEKAAHMIKEDNQ